jgi:hypothetical protein
MKYQDMNDNRLSELVRLVVSTLDKTDPDRAKAAIQPLKNAGLTSGLHMRKGLNARETLEWYAGQIIDVIDTESWFAVNSIIQCVDEFAPVLTSEREMK